MRIAATDPRFRIQQVSREEWLRATAANLAADALAGYPEVALGFLEGRRDPELADVERLLREGTPDETAAYVAARRSESLVFLVLMLTGGCNADCEICFTDRRRKPGELEPHHRDRLLREARSLGCRFVYVPGEGEPTIDPGFWGFLATCRELGMEAIVFTNGIVLADEASCRRYWGISPPEAVRRLADYPVSFYHKLWSLRPELVAEMMHISPALCRTTEVEGTPLPLGLVRLLEALPRERVGIEVVVERRNADEVAAAIVPWAQAHGVARIVELIQHNGRVFGSGAFDPSAAQAQAVQPLLSPTSCTMATCKAVVTSRGYLSPRLAVLEHQLPIPPRDVRTGDLFDLLHTTDYVVRRRYQVHTCLCETLPLEWAAGREAARANDVTMPAGNVAPGAWAETVRVEEHTRP